MKNLTIKYLLDKTNKLSPINDGNEIRFKDKNVSKNQYILENQIF